MDNGSHLIRNRKFIKPFGNNRVENRSPSNQINNDHNLSKEEKKVETKYYLEIENDLEVDNDVEVEHVRDKMLSNETAIVTELDATPVEIENRSDSESEEKPSGSSDSSSFKDSVMSNRSTTQSEGDSDSETKFILKNKTTKKGRKIKTPQKLNL